MPRNAAECQTWLDQLTDEVTAVAKDADAAFAFFTRVEMEGTTFEALRNTPDEHKSLDAKTRAYMSKRMSGKDAEQCKGLVSFLTKRRDELKRGTPPLQIAGLQLVWLVRHYYRIQDTDTVQYELSALMGLEYPGDKGMDRWKDHWDKMLRHCKTKLSEKDK